MWRTQIHHKQEEALRCFSMKTDFLKRVTEYTRLQKYKLKKKKVPDKYRY